jgi:UDP-N-acetylmuramoyl-tripeptide--D-alanyl-D-alanine ligase
MSVAIIPPPRDEAASAPMMDTAAAARATGGRAVGPVARFVRVHTDTRTIAPGDLFVALAGERFDGHDFVREALARGAVAALVRNDRVRELAGAPLVAVPDTLAALGALAAHWRRRFELPVVAVSGSNGKTTTKEMVAAIFRAAVGTHATAATAGNLNNAIGVPLTVLRLHAGHRLAVFELGMNHRGETRELAAIVAPTVALVTNAQREHQEFMRSVAEVAEEHADAIAALPPGGTAIVNADDAHCEAWTRAAARIGARVLTFGLSGGANVTAALDLRADGTGLQLSLAGATRAVHLHVPGRHMAQNALAAAAAAHAAGVDVEAIASGLAAFRPVAGRLVPRRGRNGSSVIDDTYNANPDSVRAAIDVLAALPGERWLVLGDMGEVGEAGPAFHREVGAYARGCGITRLYAAGELARDAGGAFGGGAQHHDSVAALASALAREDLSGASVLVKGSRFMRMERVVDALTGEPRGGGH